jgi:uncharacterized membrane protein YecN with MAPEG domain
VYYIYLVILLALTEYLIFGYLVSRARTRTKLAAPAVTGDAEFERYFRVQQNTIEQLIVVIPAIWIGGLTMNPLWPAGLGAVYVVARGFYAYGYIQSPPQRHYGFLIGLIATIALVVAAFLGVLKPLVM